MVPSKVIRKNEQLKKLKFESSPYILNEAKFENSHDVASKFIFFKLLEMYVLDFEEKFEFLRINLTLFSEYKPSVIKMKKFKRDLFSRIKLKFSMTNIHPELLMNRKYDLGLVKYYPEIYKILTNELLTKNDLF